MRHLLLVDGHSILFRAFYGMRRTGYLTDSKGRPTATVHTFLSMLLAQLEARKYDGLVVCFDRPEKTFRHQKYEAYKANRSAPEPELLEQLEILQELLKKMEIKTLSLPGFEADDLIGTLTAKASKEGFCSYIFSGDRDDFQLLSEQIIQLYPGRKEILEVSAQNLPEVFHGMRPDQVVDFKAIVGDSSDHIPGVKGLGEKAAQQLLSIYQDLDDIYAHLDEIKPLWKKKLEENQETAFLSRELAQIDRDVPLDLDFSTFSFEGMFAEQSADALIDLGLQSVRNRCEKVAKKYGLEMAQTNSFRPSQNLSNSDERKILRLVSEAEKAEAKAEPLLSKEELVKKAPLMILLSDLGEEINLDLKDEALAEAPKPKSKVLDLLLIAPATEGQEEHLGTLLSYACYEDWFLAWKQAELKGKTLLLRSGKAKLKEWLACGLDFEPDLFDLDVALYALGEQVKDMSPEKQCELILAHMDFLDLPRPSFTPSTLSDSFQENADRSERNPLDVKKLQDNLHKALACFDLYQLLQTMIHDRGLEVLIEEIEMPLIYVLAKMEREGIELDPKALLDLDVEMKERIETLEQRVYERNDGEVFNLNSPQQLSDFLFQKLKLPTGKKSQSGRYSTAAEVLEKLVKEDSVVEDILTYRKLSKLRSTFVQALQEVKDQDGRVRTQFNQTVTATGRLSSSNPNLQNIPIRSEEGRRIRHAFVAKKDYLLLDGDYSQVELRVLAEMANDEAMIDAFLNDRDIHTETAVALFGGEASFISTQERAHAKTVNFSVVYGVSEYGLSQNLDISFAAAKRYIQNFYDKHPAIKAFFTRCLREAEEKGYVETLFGRRRYTPELKSAKGPSKKAAERAAMNMPIQGTAADVMKRAMVRVSRAYEKEGIDAKILLQVHDELLIEAHQSVASKAAEILKREMETAFKMSVPLTVDVGMGTRWDEAH